MGLPSKEFEGEEGWVSNDEISGKDRKVESVFVFEKLERAKKVRKAKKQVKFLR